jgi:hypothetical protein
VTGDSLTIRGELRLGIADVLPNLINLTHFDDLDSSKIDIFNRQYFGSH